MWLTFRQMRVSQSRATAAGGGPLLQLGWRQKRFKWYALYSWGCPAIISLVTGELLLRTRPQRIVPTEQRWALGCVNSPPLARESQEVVLTRPRARLKAHF